MNMDAIPIGLFLAATIIIIVVAFEVGLRLAVARRRPEREKEAPVSAITASILGLVAFMLAFTFGIVTNRYDARKELVRNEANAIGTAYLRSDILPEPARSRAKELFREYVDYRLQAAQSQGINVLKKTQIESARIHRQLWEIAITNARENTNEELAARYIESLNAVIDIHALRVATIEYRIPNGIWLVLYILVILGMAGLGYQTAISGSRRSWAMPMLAFSFAVVLALLISLDRPQSGFIKVSQKPIADVRAMMEVE